MKGKKEPKSHILLGIAPCESTLLVKVCSLTGLKCWEPTLTVLFTGRHSQLLINDFYMLVKNYLSHHFFIITLGGNFPSHPQQIRRRGKILGKELSRPTEEVFYKTCQQIFNKFLREKMKSTPETVKKIRYVECQKGGFHYGEVINMVCMQPSCLEDLTCCCACVEESHKKHMTMPLKMVMEEAKQQAELIKPTNFNIDVILDIMNTSQKATLQIYKNCRKEIEKNLDDIEKSLIGYYNSVTEQIKLKNSDPKAEVSAAFEVIGSTEDPNQLKTWTKKLVAMIPNKENEQQRVQISEQELIESINTSNEEINLMISKNVQEVNSKLRQYQKTLEEEVNNTNIWKKTNNFKFSSTFKHPDIKVLSDLHVKSTNTSGYKFAVMEPGLEKGNANKTFYFKIKECSSNWVAVGMCHKNIVATKNYGFNFSNLGHGGYMISANGGTWSNTSSEYNNKVKAFKFAKNDVISVTVDMGTKKILFKKKAETYEIPFQTIGSDELHPCALFYYINDEVQFLPNFKP